MRRVLAWSDRTGAGDILCAAAAGVIGSAILVCAAAAATALGWS